MTAARSFVARCSSCALRRPNWIVPRFEALRRLARDSDPAVARLASVFA